MAISKPNSSVSPSPSDKVQGKSESSQEVAFFGIGETIEDTKEVFKLQKPFKDIMKVRNYFEKNKSALEDIDIIDVMKNPKKVMAMITGADKHIGVGINAVRKIAETNLRFSSDFLGENIAELNETLSELNGTMMGLFHRIVRLLKDRRSWLGRALAKAMGQKKKKEILNLNLAIKMFSKDVYLFKTALTMLVDPKISEYSNNKILNMYLQGEETVDSVERIVRAIEKIGKIVL